MNYSGNPEDLEAEGYGPAPPAGDARPLIAAPARLPDPRGIAPRRWLVERTLIRGFVSVVVAAGGTGKTALTVALTMGCITGQPFTGHHIYKAVPAWFLNLEDPAEEMDRRVAAAMLHHDIPTADVAGRLFVHSGRDRRVCVARLADGRGTVLFPDRDAIRDEVKRNGIGVVVVDPFIASHDLGENDNATINAAARAWAQVAHEGNCAVLLVHHTRKGSDSPGDPDQARGAKALVDASRFTLTLTGMSEAEAKAEGIPPHERKQFVRLDDGKVNLAPGSAKPRWYRLVGVPLHNGDDDYPDGDNVQTVEAWEPAGAFGDLTDDAINAALALIERGLPNGSRYTAKANGKDKDRWAVALLVQHLGRTEEQARAILAQWLRSGLLVEQEYRDPNQRKDRTGLVVDAAKRPGARG